jgi:RND family efflux transporter MFP subunit
MLIDLDLRRRAHGVPFTAFVFLSAAVLLSSCSGSDSEAMPPGAREPSQTTPTVEAVQARYGALPLEARFSGTVRADNQVEVYPDISAPVERVDVEDGDVVRAGQPLIYLRDASFRDQLLQAEAALQMARADARSAEATLNEIRTRLNRTRELAEKQYQSAAELEAIEAQSASAEAGYEQALARIAQAEATVSEREEALSRTIVRAPITGSVGQRNVEVGMRIGPSTRLFTIGNLENVRIQIPVSDEMLGQIEVGQPAMVFAGGMDQAPIQGEVARISPFLEAGSFSAAAEIDVDNQEGRLRPGMFVQVDVHYGQSSQATLVPVSALWEDPASGEFSVYVAPAFGTEIPVSEPDSFDSEDPPPASEPTSTDLRTVTILARGRDVVGVEGIAAGDWVVTVGQNLLNESLQDQPEARIRAVPWSRVTDLQELQDEDLLREFMDKQQRLSNSGATASTESTVSTRPVSTR